MMFIAGGSGGLGRKFLDRGFIGTHYSKPYKDSLFFDFSIDENDVFRFLDEQNKNNKLECILSTISYTDVDGSERNPEKSKAITKNSNISIAKWSKENDIPFIFISTNDIFNGKKGLYLETDDPDPINFYAKHKYETEQFICDNLNKFLILRCSLLEEYSSFKRSPMIVNILKSIYNGEQINLFNDSFNSPVYVSRVVNYVLNDKKKWSSGTIRHLYSDRVSKNEIGDICSEICGKKIKNNSISISDFDFEALRPMDVSLLSNHYDGKLGSIFDNIKDLISVFDNRFNKNVECDVVGINERHP